MKKRTKAEARFDAQFELPKTNTAPFTVLGVIFTVAATLAGILAGQFMAAGAVFAFGLMAVSAHAHVARTAQLAEWRLEREMEQEWKTAMATKEGREP